MTFLYKCTLQILNISNLDLFCGIIILNYTNQYVLCTTIIMQTSVTNFFISGYIFISKYEFLSKSTFRKGSKYAIKSRHEKWYLGKPKYICWTLFEFLRNYFVQRVQMINCFSIIRLHYKYSIKVQ